MTTLDARLHQLVTAEPRTVRHHDRDFVLSLSHERAGSVTAVYAVTEGDQLLGYVTDDGGRRYGALKARLWGTGMPLSVRTVEQALDVVGG
ncbi:hypothetical protein [Frigoribacterium salinisoli]